MRDDRVNVASSACDDSVFGHEEVDMTVGRYRYVLCAACKMKSISWCGAVEAVEERERSDE